jgi:hypothetical protein
MRGFKIFFLLVLCRQLEKASLETLGFNQIKRWYVECLPGQRGFPVECLTASQVSATRDAPGEFGLARFSGAAKGADHPLPPPPKTVAAIIVALHNAFNK